MRRASLAEFDAVFAVETGARSSCPVGFEQLTSSSSKSSEAQAAVCRILFIASLPLKYELQKPDGACRR
jgi:hypothetical protein